MPRTTRWLWIVAIVVVALALVGTLVGSVIYERARVAEWTAKLLPREATVLRAATFADHHLITYRTPRGRLLIAMVHPPHPRPMRSIGGVWLDGHSNDTLTQSRDSVHSDVQWFDVAIDSTFVGDIRVKAEELRNQGGVTEFAKQELGVFVVSWR